MNMSVIFSAAVFNAGGVFHILCVQAIDHFVVTTVTCDCYPSQNTRSENSDCVFFCVCVLGYY